MALVFSTTFATIGSTTKGRRAAAWSLAILVAIATMLTSARPASRELVRGEPVGVLANLTGFKNVSNLLGSNSPFSPTSWATSNFSNLGGINNLSNLGNLKMANLGDRKLANLGDKKSANLGDTKSANGGGTKSINSQGNWSKSLFPGSNRLPQRNKMGSKPLGYPYFDSNIAGMLLIILQI